MQKKRIDINRYKHIPKVQTMQLELASSGPSFVTTASSFIVLVVFVVRRRGAKVVVVEVGCVVVVLVHVASINKH
jgi:hypothetical protein